MAGESSDIFGIVDLRGPYVMVHRLADIQDEILAVGRLELVVFTGEFDLRGLRS